MKTNIIDENLEGGLKELNKLICSEIKSILSNYSKFVLRSEEVLEEIDGVTENEVYIIPDLPEAMRICMETYHYQFD